MPLTPGSRIGPYQITAAIGAGGMGEVYRALDTTLDREVAIKVLPEIFATDQERVTRFTREAKMLASLNHQNIAHVHGVVENPFALVMEHVDGQDLAQRMKLGPIPLDEAIAIAKQVADALECAHEQGIVHRDLKPANIKVRPDGMVKVLDFGLAKALSGQTDVSGPSSALMLSPTFTSPAMTQVGIILGTAAYMAPEQARGKAVDKRADVWAFGAVLFEMLSGKRAFEGSEVSDTLAYVLTKEPDWGALPPDTPPAIRRLLARCLQKDRKLRLADISDARLELDEALTSPATPTTAPVPARRRWMVPAVAVVSLAMGVLIGIPAALRWLAPPPPTAPVLRFTIPLPQGQEFTNTGRHFIAVSRDGSRIVYVANQQLYLRTTSSFTAQPIPGSASGAGVINPVFSPDGEYVAYYSDNSLRRIAVAGGAAFTLASLSNPFGMFWDESGIYAAQAGGIVRIPPGGGKAELVATVEKGETALGPQVLPGGETLVFTIVATSGEGRLDKGRIVAHSLRTGERKLLYEGGCDGQVLPSGHLLFSVGSVLYTVRLDPKTLAVSGTSTAVLESVRRSGITGASMARVSSNGTLAYVTGTALTEATPRILAAVDRTGKVSPLDVPAAPIDTPRLSPDGTRLAMAIGLGTGADNDIWIKDLRSKTAMRKLTFGGRNRFPAWSPDGRRIAFFSSGERAGIYVQDSDGLHPPELVLKSDGASMIVESWSIDDWLAVTVVGERVLSTHVVSLKDRKLVPFAVPRDGHATRSAAFSPNGKWLAYAYLSDSGTPQTILEPFPATGAKFLIADGGHPAWTRDGKELVINTRGGSLAVFSIATTPRVEFTETGRVPRGQMLTGPVRGFDIAANGKDLIALFPNSNLESPAREVNVVLNWFHELEK